MDAAAEGHLEAPQAVEAALHSLFTLKTTPAGVAAILDEESALRKICHVLLTSHLEACKLVLDMLLHILIFSEAGYCSVVQVSGYHCSSRKAV